MKKNGLRVPYCRELMKIPLTMKLILILVFTGIISTYANISSYSQNTRLTFKLKGVSVKAVLEEIENASEFIFVYYDEVLDTDRKVDIEAKEKTVDEILDQLFKSTENGYEIIDRQIVITKRNDSSLELSAKVAHASDQAQRITVTGTVTDAETGEALIGVNIVIDGTSSGVISDIDGNYTIEVPASGTTLKISFIGYEPQMIPVSGSRTIHIKLAPSVQRIDEVVIVGYGQQKKESVVGAISRTSGEEIKRMNTNEVSNSLTGLIPGLVTVKSTGLPGGFGANSSYDKKTQIYIRGLSTWNGGEPLVLVDGVERSLDDLDANEIESISVLKDASATAVFGVRGANGVILITSKRGKESKPKITFEGQVSTSMISRLAKPLNSYQANLLKNYAIINEVALSENAWQYYKPQEVLNYYRTQQYPEIYPDVDWTDVMLKDAAQSHKFSTNVTGGTKFVKYFGSLSYVHEGGILDGQDEGQGYESNFSYNRFNFRSNLDFQLTKTTKLGLNLAGYYALQHDPGGSGNTWRTWSGVYGFPPDLYPVRYSDGYYANYQGFDKYPNPYIELNFKGVSGSSRSQINTDINFEQKLDVITKGLSVTADVSIDNSLSGEGPTISDNGIVTKYIDPRILMAQNAADSAAYIIYYEPSTTTGYDYVEPPVQYYGDAFGSIARQMFYQLALRYNREFGSHSVSGLALVNRTESASGSSFLSKREDWVGRMTYDYDDRYFLEVNAGYNGSEKFDRKYRFGLFPSVAGGWMISNEGFFKRTFTWWNAAKIRYSYGTVGSDQGIDRWLYVSSWNKSSTEWDLSAPYPNKTGYPISREGAIANSNIRWETAVKQNLGVELGFLDNSLRVNFEYFRDDRKDMLIASSLRASPDFFGSELPPANLGRTRTKGYEFEVMYDYRNPSGISFFSKYAFGYARDRILFRDDPELLPDYQKQQGYAIGQTRTYVNSGIIQSWDDLYTGVMDANNTQRLPGDFRRIDFNADGVINNNDVVPYMYPTRPEYNYSLNLGLKYKGFSLSALLYGVFNVSYSQSYYRVFDYLYSVAYPWHLNESWSPENGNTTGAQRSAIRYVTPYEFGYNNIRAGSYDIVDGSYLRLKNAELAYEFSSKALNRFGVDNLRLYLSGYDLLYWSNLREDREGGPVSEGQSVGTYPLMKRFTLGLSISL